MNQTPKCILLAIVLFLFSNNLTGQNKIDSYSVSHICGAYFTDNIDQLGFMFGVKGNIMNNRFLYSINYCYGEELVLFFLRPARNFNQVAIMFGRYKHLNSRNTIRMEYQAGIAALWGIRHTEYNSEGFFEGFYDTETYMVPGLLLEAGMEFVLSKYFGIGTHVNFNLTPQNSIISFTANFSFGSFNRHSNQQ